MVTKATNTEIAVCYIVQIKGVPRFGTFWHHEAPCGTIWCQKRNSVLALYGAKTGSVLALYGAKNGIRFGTIYHRNMLFLLFFKSQLDIEDGYIHTYSVIMMECTNSKQLLRDFLT